MTVLIFIDGDNDAAAYPEENLISMTCAADTTLLLHFKSSVGDDGGADLITLTITTDKEKTVMESISSQLGRTGSATIADDVASQYVSSYITACAITLDT